jgi:hypothetical protein
MDRAQLKILADAKGKFEAAWEILKVALDTITDNTLDPEIENIGNLKEKLQEEYDDLDAEKQDANEGQELEGTISEIEELMNELDTLKDELGNNPFEDVINKIDGIK